jgi:hypothetical protein
MTEPLINGQAFDFSNVTIDIPGLGNTPVVELNYSDSLEFGELRANGTPAKIAITTGPYAAEASMTLEKKVHRALMRALAEVAPNGQIYQYEFPITVVTGKAGEPTITDTLVGVRYGGAEASGSGGSSDALVIPISLALKHILWDGIALMGPDAV